MELFTEIGIIIMSKLKFSQISNYVNIGMNKDDLEKVENELNFSLNKTMEIDSNKIKFILHCSDLDYNESLDIAFYEIQRRYKNSLIAYYFYLNSIGITRDYFFLQSSMFLTKNNFDKIDVLKKIYQGDLTGFNIELEIEGGKCYLLPNSTTLNNIIDTIEKNVEKHPNNKNLNSLYNSIKNVDFNNNNLIIEQHY